MRLAEAAALLTICASFDNRKPDADQAQAWALAMADLRFIDCRDAIVAHYQRTTDWVMPYHVIKGVKAVRSQRVKEHFAYFQPPDGCTNEEYDHWFRSTVEAIGDGELTRDDAPPAALPRGRGVVAELESRGLRANALPVEHITSRAEQLKQAARAAKAERLANARPEPEPLLQPHEYSREPTTHREPTPPTTEGGSV